MSRWLITGAAGMLGRDVADLLRGRDVALTALDRKALDITDPGAVADAVAGHDLVVNTAAWTDVDGAEEHESEATRINGTAVGVLAAACRRVGARLIQISTDYVFDGTGQTPYAEDDPTGPCNAYGRGKLVGEQAVRREHGYIVRTSWLYGQHGRNFPATMLRLARDRDTLAVVDDQRGQPTWTVALARQLAGLGEAALSGDAAPGVYHGTASGQTTWYGLARATFELAGLDPDRITPTTTDAFPRPAPRPAYSVLGHARWQATPVAPQPVWREQLAEAFAAGVFEDPR
ncbi:dTDP-4-dehydrorhamnose reductase [Allorhizocola rhizosphaerae]|uniref:dTDP-4-dehydrorhamnose reductase n=1 Tax=Allorhizocola rhizosphaerae TaxID=1872709 RepID=UPI000E3CEF63|nr:dTDP-4-dehydrorhamnose reductase [Allorhizocola rhizosphaerae]